MKKQMSQFSHEPEERKQLEGILFRLIYMTWLAYLIVIVSGLFWLDQRVIIAALVSSAILIVPFQLLRHGQYQASGIFLVMILISSATLLATVGQGIHDVSIMAYPTIIIFGSLALGRFGFRMSVVMALVAMAWLVFGEAGGLFVSKQNETPNWMDYIVITMILIVAAMAVQLLSANMRKNLTKARSEIAQRILVEEVLREKEVQYHNLADSGMALIWSSGTDKLCHYFNLPWLSFTGRTLEQEIGNGWLEGVHADDRNNCNAIYSTAFDKREAFEMEYRLKSASGEYRWITDMGTPNYNSNKEFVGYIGHCFDITERKQAEEQLRYQSNHDTLTDIYNRNFFEEELTRLDRGREFPISIIVTDVDGLKIINDTIGHSAGDDLLRQTAHILCSAFRDGDILARIGGDEFAALLPSTDTNMTVRIVSRIIDLLDKHNTIHPDMVIKLSIGSATSVNDSLVETFTLADQRMYAEKASHKIVKNV